MPRLLAVEYEQNWCSAVGALTGVLRALGADRSAARVSALSGHAFRLAIVSTATGAIGAQGVNEFSASEAAGLYENLGWRFEAIDCSAGSPELPACRTAALRRIQDGLRHGRPAIVFGLHLPEFGIVRGVEDGHLIAGTIMSAQYGERIPFEQWPAPGHDLPIRAFLPTRPVNVEPNAALDRLLAFVLRYARTGEVLPATDAVTGLAAFERWAALLESRAQISAHGQAYVVQALQSGRAEAAAFLSVEAHRLPPAASALLEAARAYTAEVMELSRMATLFPFPTGGDPNSTGMRAAGAGYVRRAHSAEAQAIEALEQAYAAVHRTDSKPPRGIRFRLPVSLRRRRDSG